MVNDWLPVVVLLLLATWLVRLNRGMFRVITVPLFVLVWSTLITLACRPLGVELFPDGRPDWMIWATALVGLGFIGVASIWGQSLTAKLDRATGRVEWWQTASVEELIRNGD